MRRERVIRQNVFPLLAALIWGTAFVAQSVVAEHIGPFTFNTARSVIAFIFLLALSLLLRRFGPQEGRRTDSAYWKELLIAGACCGTVLTVASNLQQKGLETTTPGKAGFITALYIVLVPIAGTLLGRRPPRTIWASVALAVAGLYCLCITEGFSIARGDFYLLLCALCFTGQILTIDHFAGRVDGVELSCVQFFVVGVLSGTGMAVSEPVEWAELGTCLWPILYVGVFSSGVAYTLQILAQRGSDPSVVALLLSMESVVATIAGALILHARMSGREYLGCGLMLAAVILAQLPDRRHRRRPETAETGPAAGQNA